MCDILYDFELHLMKISFWYKCEWICWCAENISYIEISNKLNYTLNVLII